MGTITGRRTRPNVLLRVVTAQGLENTVNQVIQGCVNLGAQKQWTGLPKAKVTFHQRSYRPGLCTLTMTCPVRNLWSDHPGRLLSAESLFLVHSQFY